MKTRFAAAAGPAARSECRSGAYRQAQRANRSPAHAAEPTPPAESAQPRTVEADRDVLEKNNALAECNRHWLAERGILVVNLMSSPGSGKMAILRRTIAAWNP